MLSGLSPRTMPLEMRNRKLLTGGGYGEHPRRHPSLRERVAAIVRLNHIAQCNQSTIHRTLLQTVHLYAMECYA